MSGEEAIPRVHPLRQVSVFIYAPLVNMDTFLLLFTTTLLAEKLGAGILIGLIVPAYIFAAFWTGLFWGWMADKHGRRPPLIISGAFTILGLILFALAANPWHLIIANAIRGIGGSAGLLIARVLVADLAPRKALGERIAGFSLAMYAGSLAILWLGIGYGGVLYEIDTHLPFLVAAISESVALLIAVFAIPETLGKKSLSTETIDAEERRLSRTYRLGQGVKEWVVILSRRGVTLYILTILVGALVGRIISTLVYPLFEIEFGLTPTQMSIIYTISMLISLLGMIPGGIISDMIGRKWPVLFAGFYGALTNFFYTLIPGMTTAGIAFQGFLLISLVGGVASFVSGPAFLAYFYEWLSPKERGRASAMIELFENVAVTFGLPLAAFFYKEIDPLSAFYFAAIVGILVYIAVWATWKEAPLPEEKWKLRKSTIVLLAAEIVLVVIFMGWLFPTLITS